MSESLEQLDAPPSVAIITGMSGAGRTQVAKVLEDLDYFVIDNLPPTLLDKVVELAGAAGSEVERLALVADIRGGEFFATLAGVVDDLKASGVDVKVLFLEADDESLISRFESTRRRHPAAVDGGVTGGIQRERDLLTELRGMADIILDTSELNVHQLRDRVIEAFGATADATMQIKVMSFGFKRGVPRDGDLVLDVRFLPNPHWIPELRAFTGLDDPVRDFVLDHPQTGPFVERLQDLLDVAVPGYIAEGKRHLTVAIGCTGGKHRSVAIAQIIGEHLEATSGMPVVVHHRDLGRE